jgi:hypothetical protein
MRDCLQVLLRVPDKETCITGGLEIQPGRTADGIFPLGFGRQPQAEPGSPPEPSLAAVVIQPEAEEGCVVPGIAGGRMRSAVRILESMGVERAVLSFCDRGSSDLETLELNPNGPLVVVPLRFVLR